ncbi:GL22470 [Drosophila persimilis]|uniref:GL22470 n=1 Tax=Drosophila persimilis TaxID=7234 RepID=B4H1I6_DROPE|nr:GL22470 [Drosophila persimilis]
MFHLGKQFLGRAPKLHLSASTTVTGAGVQSATRNLNQTNNKPDQKLVNHNLTHKRLSSSSQSSSVNQMKRLAGKVAVVTASTDGIGFAIAKRLAEDGAAVVISSRKQRTNAATNPAVGGVLDCDEKVWDKIFDVNVKSSYLLAKEALPFLRQEKGSSIVFVSSIAGYDAFELLGAYSVSKTALIGLTKAAAKDLAPEGIRVNCLAPGIIKTKFSKALYEDESANDAALMKIPMGRLGTSEEMAGVVSFLVSEDAAYITGEAIVAGGGMSARL